MGLIVVAVAAAAVGLMYLVRREASVDHF